MSLRRIFYYLFRWPVNYFFALRERGASAVCLIENDGGFLFVRSANFPSLWALPGGRVKKNESAEAAIIREAREETGISLGRPELFGEQLSKRKGGIISRTYCFHAEIGGQKLNPDRGEILEARWFGKNDLPQPQSPTTERAIKLFNNRSINF